MTTAVGEPRSLDARMCQRAVESRDARFDGVFFVGITTTHIYCRPICPARVSYPERRRFFDSACAAEQAGYRPCLRCRPELAPGRAICDSVSQLARAAAMRIVAGALNGRRVAGLARELGVSERHLRRAMEREIGASPLDLAQTHRLLLAKQLIGETTLPVTQVAYASGFRSLRRFNTAFRQQYALSPSAVRRGRLTATSNDDSRDAMPGAGEGVRLSLAYRAPFAWGPLVALLAREAVPGIEVADGTRYTRTLRLDGCTGWIDIRDGARGRAEARPQLHVTLSLSLLPVLMPLRARLRQLFDLDAEPEVIDRHLGAGGLADAVRRVPGLRLPGAIDGFEAALRALCGRHLPGLATALGEPVASGDRRLLRLMPDASRIADAGPAHLRALGLPAHVSRGLVTVARELLAGRLVLDPSADAPATIRALRDIDGIGARRAHAIVARALHWPDAFPPAGRGRTRTARVLDAERWRPWRAYAALHLALAAGAGRAPSSRRLP